MPGCRCVAVALQLALHLPPCAALQRHRQAACAVGHDLGPERARDAVDRRKPGASWLPLTLRSCMDGVANHAWPACPHRQPPGIHHAPNYVHTPPNPARRGWCALWRATSWTWMWRRWSSGWPSCRWGRAAGRSVYRQRDWSLAQAAASTNVCMSLGCVHEVLQRSAAAAAVAAAPPGTPATIQATPGLPALTRC